MKMKKLEWLLENKFNLFLFIVHFVVGLICVFCHEIWRDEAQVWLVVRDLNLLGVIEHVRNEGHPLLWYFLVFPLAKLGLPVFSMQLLSFAFMSLAAWFFIWKSPFNKLVKVSVILSAGFLYWLTVISRNYSLIPLFLFLLAYYYPKQKEKPYIYSLILAILANTHVLMCGFCAGLVGLFLWDNIIKNNENKKNFIFPFLIMAVSVVGVVLYIATRPHLNSSVVIYSMRDDLTFISVLKHWFTCLYGQINYILVPIVFIGLSMLILFLNDKKIFSICLFSCVYQLYIYINVWGTSPEKAYTFLLILLFSFWILYSKNTKLLKNVINVTLIGIFASSFLISSILVKNDVQKKYSDSKSIAKFIEENIDKNAVLLANHPGTTTGIIAYLPKCRRFYSHFTKDYYTYEYTDKNNSEFTTYEIPKELSDQKVYFLYNLIEEPKDKGKVIYNSKGEPLLVSEWWYIIEAN